MGVPRQTKMDSRACFFGTFLKNVPCVLQGSGTLKGCPMMFQTNTTKNTPSSHTASVRNVHAKVRASRRRTCAEQFRSVCSCSISSSCSGNKSQTGTRSEHTSLARGGPSARRWCFALQSCAAVLLLRAGIERSVLDSPGSRPVGRRHSRGSRISRAFRVDRGRNLVLLLHKSLPVGRRRRILTRNIRLFVITVAACRLERLHGRRLITFLGRRHVHIRGTRFRVIICCSLPIRGTVISWLQRGQVLILSLIFFPFPFLFLFLFR